MPNAFQTLKIGGKEGYGAFIARAELRRAIDDLDSLTVDLALGEGVDTPAIIAACQAGATWEMKVGTTTVKGDIVKSTLRTGSGFGVTIQLLGLEQLHRLRTVPVCASFEKTAKDVVVDLGKLGQVTISASAVGAPAAPAVVVGESALDAVLRFAMERNFAVWMDGTKVVFAQRGKAAQSKTFALRMGAEISELEHTLDLSDMPTGVRVFSRGYAKDEAVDYKAQATDLRKISGGDDGPTLRKKAFGEALMARHLVGGASTANAVKERAIGEFQFKAERFVTGRARCPAEVLAAPGMELKIEDATWPLVGPYLISAVTLRARGVTGVDTDIEFFSDSLPRKK